MRVVATLVVWALPSVVMAAAPALPPASEPAPPVESAPPPSADGAPPIQRPKSMQQPTAPPVAVDPPVATLPIESSPFDPPQPTAATPSVASAPPPATAPPPAVTPPTDVPATTDPFEESRPSERRISPTFRRPGVWVATGASFLALGTVLRFIFPSVTKQQIPCVEGESCSEHEMTPGGIGVLILSVPVDVMTLLSFGFAGRGYGLHSADRSRRAPAIGVGAAFLVVATGLQIASFVLPFESEKLHAYSYGIAGIREAAIIAGSAGGFLLGYGVALPRPQYATGPRRRLAIAPSLGRTHMGVAITIR
jgi:hypothetical protein